MSMQYNWIPASTAKGRERLKELMDSGIRVVGKIGNRWKMISMWKGKGGLYHLTEYLLTESTFIESNLSGVEFLDPEPQPPQWEQMTEETTFEDGEWVCFKFLSGECGTYRYDLSDNSFGTASEVVLYNTAQKLKFIRIPKL